MLHRTALAVLTIALCATFAPGTDFRTIGNPAGNPDDPPIALGVTPVNVTDDARSFFDVYVEKVPLGVSFGNEPLSYGAYFGLAGFTELAENASTVAGDISTWSCYVYQAGTMRCRVYRANYGGYRWGMVAQGVQQTTVYGLNTFNEVIPGVQPGDRVGAYDAGPIAFGIKGDGHMLICLEDADPGADDWYDWSYGPLALQATIAENLDAASRTIDAPQGNICLGSTVVPRCSVANLGDQPQSFQVMFTIDGIYENSVMTPTLNPGERCLLEFPPWTAGPVGRFQTKCTTKLDGDIDNSNDRKMGWVDVIDCNKKDAACLSIDAPVGTVCGRGTYEPKATVENLSLTSQTFDVVFSIADGSGYTSTRTVTLAPGEVYHVTFESWHPSGEGSFQTKCSTMLSGDINSSNDRQTGTIKVLLWPTGWVEMEQIPAGPRNKGIKDGAWLAHLPGDPYVYAIKGDRTEEFYRYNIEGNAWRRRASIPRGREDKLPYFGARGVQADSLYIYATKGDNTFGFWRYDIQPDTWVQLADVPALRNADTKVAGGTDLTYVPYDSGGGRRGGHVYLLKGHSGEFYRYNVNTGEWEGLRHAPPYVGNTLWKSGSFITYDGDRTIYADRSFDRPQGQFGNEVWTYDLAEQAWSTNPLPGMPGLPSQQSQDGGCGDWSDGSIFALKGGDTDEFWQYTPSDQWSGLEPMPQLGSSGKARKVFWGGDIVSHGCGAFFAFKGHDTPEFWRYVRTPGQFRGGQGDAAKPAGDGISLALATSPLVGRVLNVRYTLAQPGQASVTLFDMSGRVVVRRSFLAGRSGQVAVDMRNVSAGVYLARLDDGSRTVSRKLVVQR